MKLSRCYNFHCTIKCLYENLDKKNSVRWDKAIQWDKDIRNAIWRELVKFPGGIHYFQRINKKRKAMNLPTVEYKIDERKARFDRIATPSIQAKLQELSRENRKSDKFGDDWDFRVRNYCGPVRI